MRNVLFVRAATMVALVAGSERLPAAYSPPPGKRRVPLVRLCIRGDPALFISCAGSMRARFPPPNHPVTNVEPPETAPVTRAPRTTGVVRLVQKQIAAPESDANAAAVERSSVAGLALNGKLPPDTQLAVSPSKVVEFVNDSAVVLNHSGAVLKMFDLGTLFSGKTATGSDPKWSTQLGAFRP